MAKLSTHYVLPARTAPKVLERFKLLHWKHQTKRKILFRDRALTGEAVLSAIVLRFLDLSEADQERVLAEYVPRFEAMLAGGEEGAAVEAGEVEPARDDAPPRVVAMQDTTEALRRELREAGRAKKKPESKPSEGKGGAKKPSRKP